MKTFFFVLGQLILFVLFLTLLAGGPFLAIFHPALASLRWFVTHPTPTSIRYFIPLGLLLATALYVVVFLVEALARKLRRAGLWTSVVFLLALLVGFINQSGFVTRDVRLYVGLVADR